MSSKSVARLRFKYLLFASFFIYVFHIHSFKGHSNDSVEGEFKKLFSRGKTGARLGFGTTRQLRIVTACSIFFQLNMDVKHLEENMEDSINSIMSAKPKRPGSFITRQVSASSRS